MSEQEKIAQVLNRMAKLVPTYRMTYMTRLGSLSGYADNEDLEKLEKDVAAVNMLKDMAEITPEQIYLADQILGELTDIYNSLNSRVNFMKIYEAQL